MTMKRSILPALVCTLLASVPLGAQPGENPHAVQHRNECRLAAQVVDTGHPHPKRDWAQNKLYTCSEEAPPVLVRQWQRVSVDTVQVRYLVESSAEVRDRRIYEQARRTVLDRSRPDVVRVGAMLVLMRYANPRDAISIAHLRPPADPAARVRPVFSRQLDHFGQDDGPEPLPESVVLPVLILFQQVAASQSPRPVTYAAAVLARTLEADIRVGGLRE